MVSALTDHVSVMIATQVINVKIETSAVITIVAEMVPVTNLVYVTVKSVTQVADAKL